MKTGKSMKVLAHVFSQEHEDETRPLSLGLIRRLIGYTRPHAHKRNVLLGLVVLRALQLPALAWLIAFIIGGPVAHLNVRGILFGVAGYAAVVLFSYVTIRYRVRLALELGEQVIFDLRNEMFRHLHRQPMQFFQQNRLGRILSRFTTDAESVRVGVEEVLFVSIVQGGQMLVAMCLMIWYDGLLFLVVAGMAPLLWLINNHFHKRLSRAYRAVQESFSRVTTALAESVSGIRVIQGFVRQRLNSGLFQELVADHSRYNLDVARAAGVFLPMLDFSSQLFIALILVVGGWRVLYGDADVGALYQFVILSNLFFGPIQSLGNQYNHALTAMAGAERVFQMLDAPPKWTDQADATDAPAIRGRAEFRHVTFGYAPGRPVLNDICFTANPGQVVALVGHTGGGKSSIINLISKFYLPEQGEIWIDDREIRRIRSDSLHRQMGIVLQQNFLFTGTVMENIRFARPTASDAEVMDAAGRLDCLDLLAAMPEGLQTEVGERGAGISLGQRQLICFARAMLADPRILILDEATSSVDTLTEARIQKALAALLKNRTSIVVAHRLSTVRHADMVLVLEDGRIVERGNHEELLQADGLYTSLYREFIGAGEE